MADAYWIVTTSDGNTYIEGRDFPVIPGERKPWVRLVDKLATDGSFITSMRLQVGKQTVVLPTMSGKFGGYPPRYYSLCYHAEIDDVLGNQTQSDFVDVAAHYENFAVHYVCDTSSGNTSWITVTDPDALAPSPDRLAGGEI